MQQQDAMHAWNLTWTGCGGVMSYNVVLQLALGRKHAATVMAYSSCHTCYIEGSVTQVYASSDNMCKQKSAD